ncbi:hypothetical protein B0H19DRAFT_16918 [Mycena capillaripes]|nr:hypothetical protein B0H19DRAFT_16918 [Mycena capillaripes]
MLHLPRSSQISAASSIILPHLLRLSVSTDSFLHCLDTPMLQELYCCNQSNGLHSFLKRLPKLQKLFFAETETPTIPDVTRLLHAAPTITNLGIRLHLTFLGDLFSALVPESRNESTTRIPVLDTISMRVIRKFISDDENEIPPDLDQDLLMRTVESHWQHGDWRSVNLYCPKFVLSATTLQRMEILRGQGMQIRVFPSAHSLLCHVIPPDFRLYRDFGDLFDT